MSVRILQGHVLDRLAELPAQSVQCVVTSPPYWGLRDYGLEPQVWGGIDGCEHQWGHESVRDCGRRDMESFPRPKGGHQKDCGGTRGSAAEKASQGAFCQTCTAWRGSLGLEPTTDLYIAHLVEVFRAVWRIIRDDGTLWLNMGDGYAGSWGAQSRPQTTLHNGISARQIAAHPRGQTHTGSLDHTPGLKPKDLIGMPWRLAFALQAQGWYLRSDIIWNKPNPMPESVRDRPTKAHEYLFLLTKRERYYYDADAVREPHLRLWNAEKNGGSLCGTDGRDKAVIHGHGRANRTKTAPNALGRNLRSVWTIPTHPFPGAHFATFPPALVEPCIKAGSKPGDTILDPFAGAGTVLLVADRLGRDAIGVELNQAYVAMMRTRLQADAPIFYEEG